MMSNDDGWGQGGCHNFGQTRNDGMGRGHHIFGLMSSDDGGRGQGGRHNFGRMLCDGR